MVWEGISRGVESPHIIVANNLTVAKYRDKMFRPHIVPLLQQNSRNLWQDNARADIARFCCDFLTKTISTHGAGRHTAQTYPY